MSNPSPMMHLFASYTIGDSRDRVCLVEPLLNPHASNCMFGEEGARWEIFSKSAEKDLKMSKLLFSESLSSTM